MPVTLATIAACAACVSPAAVAHDFWVQPSEYWIRLQTPTSMTLQVGHGSQRQRSPLPPSRITRFDAIGPNGAKLDLRDTLTLGGDDGDAQLRFVMPGAYVLVLETDDRAQSHLPAKQFNAYLEEEGLTPALELRKRTNRMTLEGSEKYSRRAKTLVYVGQSGQGSQAHVTEPVGIPLEIVPERSPYEQQRSAELPIYVLFQGKRLPGALVKLTHLEDDAKPVEMHVTDAKGHASFKVPREGTWLLNVIWTHALPKGSDTDYETVFSSLSFGFRNAERER